MKKEKYILAVKFLSAFCALKPFYFLSGFNKKRTNNSSVVGDVNLSIFENKKTEETKASSPVEMEVQESIFLNTSFVLG